MDIDILNVGLGISQHIDQLNVGLGTELLRKSSSGNMLSFEKMCSGLDLGAASYSAASYSAVCLPNISRTDLYHVPISHSDASHSVASRRGVVAGWFGRGAGGHAPKVELQCKQWERQGAARPLLERRIDARYLRCTTNSSYEKWRRPIRLF